MDNNKKNKDRKNRANRIFVELKKIFKDQKPKTALIYKTPLELLISVILSAQCTDKRVNEVTKTLFKKYTKLEDYLRADIKQFEKDIKPTGFYKNKAKNIINTAKILKEKFNGNVPDSIGELVQLSGVARKTANVVLYNAFGIISGVAVDTHVRRFTFRFDLSDSLDAVKIEKDLMSFLLKKDWMIFSDYLIKYGREICPARKHDCRNHPLTKIYPQANNRWLVSGKKIINS